MMLKFMMMCLLYVVVVTAELIKQNLILQKKYDFDKLWSLDGKVQYSKMKSFNIPLSNMSQVEGKSAKSIGSAGGSVGAVLVTEPTEIDVHEKKHVSTKDLARIARMPRFFEERTAVERNECTPWRDSPFDPSPFVDEIEEPWFSSPQVCKMFITYSNRATFVCSGTLVGPYHFLSARHCSWDGCLGDAVQIRVACGYSYVDEEGVDNFAHYGSAFGTNLIRFGEYDDSAYCGAAYTDTRIDLDIFMLRLDRALGEQLGWYGMTNRQASSLFQIGYPGNRQLNEFIPFATDKSMFRYLNQVFQEYTNIYTTYGELSWGGESGGPWYREDGSSRYVGAVLSGGASPCITIGTFVNEVVIEAYLALRGQPSDTNMSPWSSPDDYCQLVPYQADVFSLFDNLPVIGVGESDASVSAVEVYDTSGSDFTAIVALMNSGNLDGSTILEWVVDAEIIATTSIELSSFGAYRAVTSLPISWNGVRNVYVRFSQTNCYTDDGTVQYLGQVNGHTSSPQPSYHPTYAPTTNPTLTPVAIATPQPTTAPTPAPVATATPQPTTAPTPAPVATATSQPTTVPTPAPVTTATPQPTTAPTLTPVTTAPPQPTQPSTIGTSSPTQKPTTTPDAGTSNRAHPPAGSDNKKKNDKDNALLVVMFVVFPIIFLGAVIAVFYCYFRGMKRSKSPSLDHIATSDKHSFAQDDIEGSAKY